MSSWYRYVQKFILRPTTPKAGNFSIKDCKDNFYPYIPSYRNELKVIHSIYYYLVLSAIPFKMKLDLVSASKLS